MFDSLYLYTYDCAAVGSPDEDYKACNLTSHARLHAIGETYGKLQLEEAAI
jgi:hypothetical protein